MFQLSCILIFILLALQFRRSILHIFMNVGFPSLLGTFFRILESPYRRTRALLLSADVIFYIGLLQRNSVPGHCIEWTCLVMLQQFCSKVLRCYISVCRH